MTMTENHSWYDGVEYACRQIQAVLDDIHKNDPFGPIGLIQEKVEELSPAVVTQVSHHPDGLVFDCSAGLPRIKCELCGEERSPKAGLCPRCTGA